MNKPVPPQQPDNRLWAWNWTGEAGHFYGPSTTREDAVVDALNMPPRVAEGAEHPWLYLARCAPPLASAFLPDLDTLLDGARNTANDMCSEGADGWLENITPAEHQDLLDRVATAFDDWASQHYRHPEFIQVDDIHHLTYAQAEAMAIGHARDLLRGFAGLPPEMVSAALQGLAAEAG